MSFSNGGRRVLQPLMKRGGKGLLQKRSHHPDPFNPKTTRGWKAALAVSTVVSLHVKTEIHCRWSVEVRSRDLLTAICCTHI